MSLSLSQSLTAIAPNLTSSFLGVSGTAPYTYSVRPNGAGGAINSSTGIYTAPGSVAVNPVQLYDTIQVTDSASSAATSKILVGSPLHLFREIIQSQLGLDDAHCYFWDQKIFQPTDSGLYIAIGIQTCKAFGNNNAFDGSNSNSNSNQYSTWQAILSLDIISRSFAAVYMKEQVLMALMSNYSESQQTVNSFNIGRLPPGAHFVNLSGIDGAAIPYRFNISVSLSYFATLTQAVPSYGTFTDTVTTNP